MTGNTDQILELLFGTPKLEEIPVSDLKDLLEEFPSFNAAHYLLSKKLKLESSEEYSSETQKTALYFTNPFWLQWLLEAPTPAVVPETVTQETAEVLELPIDTTGSENSVWNDHQSVSQETSSFFEESILSDQESAHKNVSEMPREEILLPETHFASFEKNTEANEPIKISHDDEIKEWVENADSRTELSNEPLDTNTNSVEDITHPVEPDSEIISEYQTGSKNGNGLNFHEPDNFREEPAEENQKEEMVTIPEPVEYQQPVEESPMTVSQETVITEPEVAQEETISRPPFFWEKEFHVAEKSSPEEAIQEEPTPIAQIPELSKPFQDNPAFLLVEYEPLVPDAGDQVEGSLHTDPAFNDFEKKEKDTVVFFDHGGSIWEPARIREEEAFSEPAAETIQEPTPLASTVEPEPVGEKIVVEEIAASIVGFAEPADQEMKTEPVATAAHIAGDELQFTPYHTIDYFASQGIRYIQEENPTDKFGKQLKSFTAWLKTMKRLPKTLLESEMNAVTEAAIQDIAEHSIEEKEVITEAMAQVLALQGQHGKAIELYQKLSLLNPSKSAYFAARIEQIKSDLK